MGKQGCITYMFQAFLHTQGNLWSATDQQWLQLKNTKCTKLNLPQLDFLTWPRPSLSCSVLHPASNISRPAPPYKVGSNYSSVFWQKVLACLSPLCSRRRDNTCCPRQPVLRCQSFVAAQCSPQQPLQMGHFHCVLCTYIFWKLDKG